MPLALKLGAYRRSLMLAGLDKSESDLKKKGISILYALKILKEDIKPELFQDLDFKAYYLDHLGQNKNISQEQIDAEKRILFENRVIYDRIKREGAEMGVDTSEIERKLRGEDDETLRAVLKERLEETKGR